MSDTNPRILELVEEALDSGHTPEEVCAQSPELLWEVRQRLNQCRQVAAQIDALFPHSSSNAPTHGRNHLRLDADLPQVPGYQIEAILGYGGMGVVYRARQLKLNRMVALKMLLAGHFATPSERARFMREAEAIAALRHENIVQIHDVGDFENRPFFTMEFVEGGSLAEKLAGVPQPSATSGAMVETLARAVHSAHDSGIVHRDLKPANILLTADGTPKVSDFGLARHFDGDSTVTVSGVRLGTPSYMAPEQALGKSSSVGPLSDVYTLGAILYEMLTGRPPFRGESSSDTEHQVISREPVPPSRLNPRAARDLETICLKCLQKDPVRRYPTASELADDLGRFQKGEPITARRAGSIERAAKWVRRRPAVALSLGTGTLLAMVLAGMAAWIVADNAAIKRAVEADLRDAVAAQQRAAWSEATAAIERGKARLGAHKFSDLQRRLEQNSSNIGLVTRLDAVRLWRVNKKDVDREYLGVFKDGGLGNVMEDPAGAADRIRMSPIKAEWVIALDDWAIGTNSTRRRDALLKVAKALDPNDWRDQVRNPGAWGNTVALGRIAQSAKLAQQPVHLLIALGTSLAKPEQALFLRRVQSAYPGDFYANLIFALSLMESPAKDEAIAFFRAAVAIRPDSGGAHYHLGLGLRAAGRTEEAVAHFELAIRLDPNDVWAYAVLGDALRTMGRRDEAIERERQALRIDPSYVTAHNNLGTALIEKGRAQEALDVFKRAEELDPRNASAYNGAGAAFALLGRLDDSIESFRNSLQVDDNDASTHSNLAAALMSKGRDDEALAQLQRALQIDPNESTAHVRLANLLLRRHQRNDAIAHYRQAVRINPKDGIANLNLGLALEGQGELDEALGYFRQAVEVRLQDPRPIQKLAALLAIAGKTDEAKATWRHVIDANPAVYDFWCGYAEFCHYLGDEAEYRRARRELLHRFQSITDPLISQRIALTCLLLPIGQEEMGTVEAIAGATVIKGLLAYRQNRFDAAITILQGEIAGTENPIPPLVLAMAMHRAGRKDEALKVLALAGRRFDWQAAAARRPEAWICHVLRREAESMILTNLAAFLEGKYQPNSNDERLALLPACQFNKRPGAGATLFTDILATDTVIAEDLSSGIRYDAACFAALAGCGSGDGAAMDNATRAHWREQSRRWLRADLAIWEKLIDTGKQERRMAVRREAQRWLTHCQVDPDLAGLRESKAIAGFTRAEQTDCFVLWDEVAAVLRRARAMQ